MTPDQCLALGWLLKASGVFLIALAVAGLIAHHFLGDR